MSVFQNRSDESLVEQALAGDDRAFGELVRRYTPVVLAWLSANNRNDGENEDLVQEALLNAYRRLANLRDRGSFGPWLVSIARNKLADYRRIQSRQVRITTVEEGSYESSPNPAGQHQDRSLGPRERVSLAETGSIVRNAIGNMGDTYREILHMRRLEEETP